MDDSFIRVGPGLAHLSHVPFSGVHPWGAWRNKRQFVGRISYGAKFQLWNPTQVHSVFPATFKETVHLFLFMKPQDNCMLSWMSNDILFYILNMCRHDWCKPSPRLAAQLKAEETEARERQAQERAEIDAMASARRGGMGRGWLSSFYAAVGGGGQHMYLGDSDDDEDDEDDEDDSNVWEDASDDGVYAEHMEPSSSPPAEGAAAEDESPQSEYEPPARAYRNLKSKTG